MIRYRMKRSPISDRARIRYESDIGSRSARVLAVLAVRAGYSATGVGSHYR